MDEEQHHRDYDSSQPSLLLDSTDSNSYGSYSLYSSPTSATLSSDLTNYFGSDPLPLSTGSSSQYPLGPLYSPSLDMATAGFAAFSFDSYPSPPTHSAWVSSSNDAGTPVETSRWADRGANLVDSSFASSPDAVSLDFQADFYGSGGDVASLPYGAAMASGSSTAIWVATAPGESPLLLTDPSPSTTSTDHRPEKIKRKRGRPRLYDDDGILRGERITRPTIRPIINLESPISVPSPEPVAICPIEVTITATPSLSGIRSRRTSVQESEDGDANPERAEIIRARNKAAAARYRAKTQHAIANMEAEEREVSRRRQALLATAGRLREEVFQLKNEVLRHADCGCPLISRYLSDAAKQAYAHLGEGSSKDSDTFHVQHAAECPQRLQDGGWTGRYDGPEDDV